MNKTNQQLRKTKNGQAITIKRTSFKRVNQPKTDPQNQTSNPNTNQNDIINVRNKIVTHLTDQHPGQKLIFTNNKPQEIKHHETILIPLSNECSPTMIRTSVCRYLVNYKDCTHSDVHNYSCFSEQDLDNKSVKYITLDKYGTDYPIVSKFNLTYCKKCVSDSDYLIVKSEAKGNLNFVSSPATRADYSHVVVPDHIPMDKMVYVDGDNIWVNLSLANDSRFSVLDLKDHIITTLPRKNYLQVFALPPPFEEMCLKFDDFGTVVYITSVDGYDDGFVITESVDSDIDCDGDEDIGPITFTAKAQLHTPKEHHVNVKLEEVHETIIEAPQITMPDIENVAKTLIIPMNTVSDFKNNKEYFNELGFNVHVAKYDQEVSVNVVLPITEKDKCVILQHVQTTGYGVRDIKDVVIYINDELVTQWSFIITSLSTEEIKPPTSHVSCYIDKYISRELEESPDESIISIVTMLEKAYLQQAYKQYKENVFLDYRNMNKCQNISVRDLNVYYKSDFAHAYQCEQYQAGIYRDVASLLIHLKYCSIIPLDLIIPTSDGILISFDTK
uniref:Uncharacterized protein n=1 Tax=Ceratitis capitata TaxID=7213 RepID=W8C891_CERCA